MRIAVVGAGAVGGYYAACLAKAGHDVAVVARGAQLEAIRTRGLVVRAARGEFVVHPSASDDPREIGPCDLVLFAVKTYDNSSALPLLPPLVGAATTVLTLQNGVDSATDAAAHVGSEPGDGGRGLHRDGRDGARRHRADGHASPDCLRRGVRRAHRPLRTGGGDPRRLPRRRRRGGAARGRPRAALGEVRVPRAVCRNDRRRAPSDRPDPGPARNRSAVFERATAEVEALARAEGVEVAADLQARIRDYVAALPGSTRSSLLIDLHAGKRIEVEALQGAVVRRAQAVGLDVPVMQTLYAILRAAAEPSRALSLQAASALSRERSAFGLWPSAVSPILATPRPARAARPAGSPSWRGCRAGDLPPRVPGRHPCRRRWCRRDPRFRAALRRPPWRS